MTDSKTLLVLKKYETHIESLLTKDAWEDNEQLKHAQGMIPKMRTFLQQGKRDKVDRWLGFVQGILYCNGIYSIEEMATHNRVTKKDLKELHSAHHFSRFRACSACGDIDGCHLWGEYEQAPNP